MKGTVVSVNVSVPTTLIRTLRGLHRHRFITVSGTETFHNEVRFPSIHPVRPPLSHRVRKDYSPTNKTLRWVRHKTKA